MTVQFRTSDRTHAVDAIVIGASAGAIDTLRVILAPIPPTFGAPMIVVVHVPSKFDSRLPDVLAAFCALTVREARDKEQVENGVVYVAPPGYHLLVEPDRSLALSLDPPVNFSRPSIDVLFESAAYAYRERLLGIVLTGANDDGADGLAAIRASGGLGWVQAPETAAAAVMPASALERAGADAVYAPAMMGAELARIASI